METLNELLRSCAGGETIDLKDESHGAASIRGFKFDVPVTVTGGRFDDLDLTDCAGLTFRHTKFFCPNVPQVYHRHRTTGCDRIRFETCEFFGDDSVPVEENHAMATLVRNSSNVSYIGCEAHHLMHAFGFMNVKNFECIGNEFHDLRVDAIRGGEVDGLLIEKNYMTDFYPVDTGGSGDHPDAIQIWEYANQDNKNIVIRDNHVERGKGRPVQGIFLRGSYTGSEGFENVTITGNVLIGCLYNAIMVSNARGAVVTGNSIHWLEDMHKTWLRIHDVEGEISGNTAPLWHGDVPEDRNTINREIWTPPTPPAPPVVEVPGIETIVLKPGETITITVPEK